MAIGDVERESTVTTWRVQYTATLLKMWNHLTHTEASEYGKREGDKGSSSSHTVVCFG